ncbi:hypothetical protein Agub_g3567 [Astrephomene gubernaculifera]|uniref:Alpha-type protein kinase domain-containing protein n=1 Tax=Astrephomene gubernaculifera TaxID=47775 RepID=A0AAD3DMP2_9CHLO|nr:hypothetical protein Agub_g3567 [Astrephomene gubernaculifera]
MMPGVAADSAASLAELEAQLSGVYAKIAQQHGLSVAMQVLGRLMLSCPAPAVPLPPPPAPVAAPPTQSSDIPAVSTPVASATAAPGVSAPPLPATAASAGTSPFSAAATATASTTTTATAAPPPPPLEVPSPTRAIPLDSPLAPAQTLESIRTMPSATLSQMPSGVMSLISPSAADAASTADEDVEDRSPVRCASPPATQPQQQEPQPSNEQPPQPQEQQPAQTQAAGLNSKSKLSQLGQLVLAGLGRKASEAVDVPGASAKAAAIAKAGVGSADSESSPDVGPGVAARVGGGDGAAAAAAVVGGAGSTAVGASGGGGGGGAAAAAAGEGLPESPRSAVSAVTRGGGGTPRSTSSLWMRAVALTRAVTDPWASRNLHALHMERAVRQRYNAMTGQWVTDEVLVKMESKPFAAGAMRECYAAKKLSTFTHNVDWHKAQNMVAKRYKKEGVKRSVYYNDVLVQMDAKMLGEMYNKTDPPKQVDVMQCAILQFPGRPGAPVYCVEQLIEGDYVKYNSNTGFVNSDDLLRSTPQAFSHFTWVLTRGLKICVDIQGVGDLYTDPQLHTLDGEGYGEGNLGLRGMALFFRSHQCNALCGRLGLKPLDRCDADVRAQGYSSSSASASGSATRAGAGRAGATASKTLARTLAAKAADRRRRAATPGGPASSVEAGVLLAALQDVPKECPEALVHLEISKLYGEVVLLPELKPNEDPEDALRGGLFHLTTAALGGSLLALLVLARAHCGLEPSAPQWAQLVKVGSRQRQFRAHTSVAWRCVLLAAERGVRGAALAAAAAYGSGGGLFGEEVLGGLADPAQAARWYAAALALPDVLAGEGEQAEGEDPEADKEGEEGSGSGSGSDRGAQEEEEEMQFEMSVMRDAGAANGNGNKANGKHHDGDDEAPPQASGMSDLHSRLLLPGQGGLRVPKLEELSPSPDFMARLRRAVEEEASALLGASAAKYEILSQYGSVLLSGGPGLPPNPARAAELLEEAAEEAGAAGKGKLAQKYYELAARAQAMCEEEGEEE